MSTPGKLKKKKKEVEFSADNLDNTAPVKKILEDLRLKNVQAYNFYCQNVRQRLTTKKHLQNFHYVVPGHPLNSFSDDWDGQLITNYFEAFPYKSLNPKIITALKHANKIDPVTEIMKIKSDWQWECRNLRVTAACSNMIQKYKSMNEDVVHCPKHFVDMAKQLDSDPDPHFDSSYNWYYAGNGNLQLVSINWKDYLLHSELSKLYISDFNKNDLTVISTPAATFDCGEGVNILETIYSTQDVVALRSKKKVFVLKIVAQDDEIKLNKLKEAESEMPYTSISFDEHHKNIMYVTTLDNKLTIVNLDRMKGRSVKLKSNTSLINNWSTVLSSERGFYTHVTTNFITLYDKRSNNVIDLWKDVRNVTDEVRCNNISCAMPALNQSMYFGTDHHLFLIDLRYSNQHKPKPVNRWTHGMQCVPTYIAKCNFELSKDLICLSSQWCEDMCVVPSGNDAMAKSSDGTTVTMPYRPPSILATLKAARQTLSCYDLYNPIDNRLHTAITGNLIIDHDEKFNILMQNSLGDITCHTIFHENLEVFMEDDSCRRLDAWCKSYKLRTNNFVVSSIEDISNVWMKLKSIPDGYNIDASTKNMKNQFNEEEIFEAFEEEELDGGLLELWTNKVEETVDTSSFALNLQFSDSDEENDDVIKL